MHMHLNGPFRVFDDLSRDVTPRGIKERGLLALILLSPGQRRTRIWLQDKLWSDRSTAQGSCSLRQALSNVRKSLGPLAARLHSDRSSIWIDPPFPMDNAFDPTMGDLLEDIIIDDPEFSDWLALLRTKHDDTAPAPFRTAPPQHGNCLAVQIRRIDRSDTARGAFILRSLSQRITAGLALLGGIDVIDLSAKEASVCDDPRFATVDLECLDSGDTAFVLLRVVGHPVRRVVWSGRLSICSDQPMFWHKSDVSFAINRTIQAVTDLTTSTDALSPTAAIQKAIRRMFECDRASLFTADVLLKTAMSSDLRAQSLAWQAAVRQTEQHEHGEDNASRLTEALDFIEHAIRLAPQNPVILALSAEFTLNTTGDVDKANFLASRAVQCDDENPYALDALGHTFILQNKASDADRIATKARHYAVGLPHSYDWDLMGCFTKIGIGDTAAALDLALTCHRKMPFGRHVLRYLTVLSYLADQPDNAVRCAEKLRRLEPGFSVQTLLGSYLPMARPRDADLMGQLRHKLA